MAEGLSNPSPITPGPGGVSRGDGGAGGSAGGGGGVVSREVSRPMRWAIAQPGLVWAIVIMLALAVVMSLVLVGMSRRVLLAPGQIASQTLVARVPVEVTDALTTEADRQAARQSAPKVYVGDAKRLADLALSIEQLPSALGSAKRLADVAPSLRERFNLTESSFAAIVREQRAGGEPSPLWTRRAQRFGELLRTTPIVDAETYQAQSVSPTDTLELLVEGHAPSTASVDEVISLGARRVEAQLRMLALTAGFGGEEVDVVIAPLLEGTGPGGGGKAEPTFRLDRSLTQQRAMAMAAAVQPRAVAFSPGEVIVTRGEVIQPARLELAKAEARAWWRVAPVHERLAVSGSLIGLGLLVALGLGAYVSTYTPQVFARPRRLASLAMLFAGGLALACGIALIDPRATIAAACVPAALVAAVLAVAYERRTALAVASLLGLAGALAVRLPIEAAVLPLAAAGLVVWQLREIRHRGTLIRTGVIAGALLVAMTLLVEQLSLPLSEAALPQMLFAAGAAGVGVLLACFVVLGLLPTIERAFGVLTPLTLIELRDPRHPLLQVLQQRAPGTWVHSMNVANLTEQACQAIGADGLLAHVGALYHDCGKMNRPEMFVENQSGINRHDKLSPSMSLLLIVSHVADGLEMAREHALPQPLWHFIEAHHGTTVVEYFYHRARKQHDEACQQAGKSVDGQPDEKQYRYPGPKPRTKEVAVMMICDAAEGAARAMTDPTAVKLEAMVRSIADKRLADAQFDQCELTMREISTIVATVSRSLASIHHGRVAYPDAARRGAGAAGAPGGGPKPIVSQG